MVMRPTVALIFAVAGCASASPVVAPRPEPLPVVQLQIDVPNAVLENLAGGKFDALARLFDPESDPPTAEQIARVWRDKSLGMGKVVHWHVGGRTFQDGFETRIATLELEYGELQCLLSIVPESQLVASLFITEPAPPARYVDRSRFREVALSVGAGSFVLPATLTLPVGGGPFPGVVLVHGSGPNDRDETVGANKIFKDLAEGLATAGIAVLRYDKRTYAAAGSLSNDALTLDTEVVDDAVDAVRTLAERRDIAPGQVYVIGHSLGAMLAPEIAVRSGVMAAGVVLIAPPGRAPWDIIREQMRYLRAPREVRANLEQTLVRMSLGGNEGTIMGLPATYWRDWANRDGIAMARQLRRVLVLHGDRDYQVTAEDFAIWRRGLAGVRGAELVSLPGDNHLLIRGTGQPTPLEYKVPGHLDERAFARILAWLRRFP